MISLPSHRDEPNPYRAPTPIVEPARDEASSESRRLRERLVHRETTLRALALVKLWWVVFAAALVTADPDFGVDPAYRWLVRAGIGAVGAAAAVVGLRMWNLRPEAPYVQSFASLAAAGGLVALGYLVRARGFFLDTASLTLLGAAVLLHGQISVVCSRPATLRVCGPDYWNARAETPDRPTAAAIGLKFAGWSVLWWLSVGLTFLLGASLGWFDG